MSNINKHFEILGLQAVDKVTGFKGVVSSLSFDLYGCVQAVVTPAVDSSGEIKEGRWFDVTRLDIVGDKPVMQLPNFNQGYISEGRKGCSFKSLP